MTDPDAQDTGRADPSGASSSDAWQTEDQYLRAILEVAPIGIGIVDLGGRTVLANETLRRMLGYSDEEFATLHFDAYTHPDDIAPNAELFGQLVAGDRDRFELEKRFFHKDGHVVRGRLICSLLRDAEGRPARAIGMLEDVTETRRLEERLRAAEENFRQLVEQVPAVVYVAPLELAGPWIYVSPQIAELFRVHPGGRELNQLRQRWRSAILEEDRPGAEETYRVANDRGGDRPVTLSYRVHRGDGSIIWIRDAFSVVTEPDGRRVVRGVLLDVTREKELEEELERLAFHDPLTDLANLRLFRDRVGQRIGRRSAPRGAVLFIDLDDFKDVNDSLGHSAGDELLRATAGRIRSCLRPEDTASRVGGDEFSILLDEVDDTRAAVRVAERIQEAIGRPVVLDGEEVTTTASIGVAPLSDSTSADDAMRNADLAMYHAKDLGKHRAVVYDPSMLEAARARGRDHG